MPRSLPVGRRSPDALYLPAVLEYGLQPLKGDHYDNESNSAKLYPISFKPKPGFAPAGRLEVKAAVLKGLCLILSLGCRTRAKKAKLLPGAKEGQIEDRAIIVQRAVVAEELDGME